MTDFDYDKYDRALSKALAATTTEAYNRALAKALDTALSEEQVELERQRRRGRK